MTTATATISAEKLLRELSEVWTDLAKDSVEKSSTGVLRACAMNLLVCVEGDHDVAATLAEASHEYPCRLIVVRVRREPGATLSGRALAQCWMPFGRRQQICSEQIEISAPTEALPDVLSVVRALWAADLPVIVWFRNDSLLVEPALQLLLPMADKVIVDSRRAVQPLAVLAQIKALIAAGRPVGDLGWTRITRWRSTIAQIFDNHVCRHNLAGLHAVTIDHTSVQPPLTVPYLAHWLESCLKRDLKRTYRTTNQSERWEIQQVTLTGLEFETSIRRKDETAVEARWDGHTAAFVYPRQTESDLLVEEFGILAPDPVFQSVLERL